MNRFIIIIVCLCFTVVFGVGILYPKYTELRILRKEIEEKRTDLKSREEHFLDLAKTSEKLKEYTDALSKIDSALPLDPNLPALFGFLQKVSSENGLILKEIKPFSIASSGEVPGIQETHLALSVSGSYPAFKNFLSVLQKTSRLIEAESVNFSSPEEGESFFFNLRIKVHSY